MTTKVLMFPFPLLSYKLLAALFSVATLLAWAVTVLLDAVTTWNEVVKAVLTGVFTILATVIVLWLKQIFTGRQKQVDQASALDRNYAIQMADASEAVAKLTAAERADYLKRIEDFYRMEREFYQERDKQKQALIEAQKEIIDGQKLVSEQLKFVMSQTGLEGK